MIFMNCASSPMLLGIEEIFEAYAPYFNKIGHISNSKKNIAQNLSLP